MRQWLRSRLTYANVMVTILAFLVLGGGTAAALSGSNTVFSDDIVDGQVKAPDIAAGAVNSPKLTTAAVNSAKVADNSLTGSDVLESSLGAVPNADKLDGFDSSAFVKAQGASFTDAGLPDAVGGCGSITGWANSNPDPNPRVGFYRDPSGMVYLQGQAQACNTSSPTIVTLPAGYRPANRQSFAVSDGDIPHVLRVQEGGTVSEPAFSSPMTLGGIVFRCGPSGQDGCP